MIERALAKRLARVELIRTVDEVQAQLISMKRMIEVWSVTVWSTKFGFAKGEATRNGRRGPWPQRVLSSVAWAALRPGVAQVLEVEI